MLSLWPPSPPFSFFLSHLSHSIFIRSPTELTSGSYWRSEQPLSQKGLCVHVRSMADLNINTAPFKEDLLGIWTFVTNPIMPRLNFYRNKPEINLSWSFYQLGSNQSIGARCWRYNTNYTLSVVIYIRLNLCCGSELWCRYVINVLTLANSATHQKWRHTHWGKPHFGFSRSCTSQFCIHTRVPLML